MAYISKWRLQNNTVVPIGSNLFGSCSTASASPTKVVALPDFHELVEGVTVHVHFQNENTSGSAMLQVGSTQARPIRYNGTQSGAWANDSVVSFTYYGGAWCQNDYQESSGGTASYGLSFDSDTNELSLVPDGQTQSVTLPNGVTYSLSISDHTVTLTGSDGSTSSVTVAEEIFIAEYDVTTYSEIEDALSDGKICFLKTVEGTDGDAYAPLTSLANGVAYFRREAWGNNTGNFISYRYKVDQSDTWSFETKTLHTVFNATYGETTYAEVQNAWQGRNYVCVYHGGHILPLIRTTTATGGEFTFLLVTDYNTTDLDVMIVKLTEVGGWSLTTKTIPTGTHTLTASITASTGTLVSRSCKRYGNVVFLTVSARKTTSTAVGGYILEANVSGIPLPSGWVTNGTYYGSQPLMGALSSSGVLRLRNTGTTAFAMGSSDSAAVSFTYVV